VQAEGKESTREKKKVRRKKQRKEPYEEPKEWNSRNRKNGELEEKVHLTVTEEDDEKKGNVTGKDGKDNIDKRNNRIYRREPRGQKTEDTKGGGVNKNKHTQQKRWHESKKETKKWFTAREAGILLGGQAVHDSREEKKKKKTHKKKRQTSKKKKKKKKKEDQHKKGEKKIGSKKKNSSSEKL